MVVTLPTAVRNRGALKRAAINIGQTRTELAHVEREVVLDVRKVRLDYEQSRSAVERFRHEILPQAQTERERSHNLFQEGEKPLTALLEAQKQFNEIVAQYLEATIRLRRSTLALNMAVGATIFP